MTYVLKDTDARINEHLFLSIRWAKIYDDPNSVKKAQFSGDLCTNDGNRVCVINRLCILNTTDKITNKPTLYVGSMSEKLPRGDTIYAITWFPNAKKGDKAEIQARDKFSDACVKAIAAFQKQELEKMDKKRNISNENHPSLKPLADIVSISS